jgi:hypothetical protein
MYDMKTQLRVCKSVFFPEDLSNKFGFILNLLATLMYGMETQIRV